MSAGTAIPRLAYNLSQIDETSTELNIYDEIASKKSYDWWTDEEGSEVTPDDFKAELDAVETPEIVVRINSNGGEVASANVIAVAIQEARRKGKKVSCKIDGMCASAAVQIALSCSPVIIHRSAYMMIHNPMAVLIGYYNTKDLKEKIGFLDSIKHGIMNTYIEKTGLSESRISKMMDETKYMDGVEAVNLGFADSLMFEEEEEEEEVINRMANIAVNAIYDIPQELKEKIAKNKKGVQENMNKEELIAKYPEIVKEIRTEAINSIPKPDNTEAINQAVNAERERMKAIDEMSGKVDAEILNKAKYETFETAEKVALDAIRNGNFINTAVINSMKNEGEVTKNVAGTANSGVNNSGFDTKQAEIANVENFAKEAFAKIK